MTMEQAYRDVIQKIQKVEIKSGDVLIFNMKTDKWGSLYLPVKQTQSFVDGINDALKKSCNDVTALFIPDKFCFSCVKDAESTVKDLKNVISYLEEAIDKVTDIKNGEFKSEVVINMEQAEDSFKRSH